MLPRGHAGRRLIAVGGAWPDAPARQLSLYATALDQLYEHTGGPADAILLRAAAALAAAERDAAGAAATGEEHAGRCTGAGPHVLDERISPLTRGRDRLPPRGA